MGLIKSDYYHAHVYFDMRVAGNLEIAQRLHGQLGRRFPVLMGRIFTVPIGPHPMPMFQVLMPAAVADEVIDWLQTNRQGLDVLVHAVTGDELADHTRNCKWLGQAHDLKLEALV